jgi:hypothetical protein
MPDDYSRGCTIPLLQSITTGVFVALIAGGVSVWLKWDALPIALITGACAALLWWYGSLQLWRADVYQPTYSEPVQATAPQITPITIHLDKQIQMVDLPGTHKQIQSLAAGLVAGTPFAESSWTGRDRPFSKAQFQAVRDEFIRRGWAAWVNPQSHAQGVELTYPGSRVCERLQAD